MTFRDRLAEQRWDDHRYYDHNRVNQALHLANTLRFSSWPPTSRGRRRHDYVGIAAAKRDDAAMHETPQGEHQALHSLNTRNSAATMSTGSCFGRRWLQIRTNTSGRCQTPAYTMRSIASASIEPMKVHGCTPGQA